MTGKSRTARFIETSRQVKREEPDNLNHILEQYFRIIERCSRKYRPRPLSRIEYVCTRRGISREAGTK